MPTASLQFWAPPPALQGCDPAQVLVWLPAHGHLSGFPFQGLSFLCRRIIVHLSIFHQGICHGPSQEPRMSTC